MGKATLFASKLTYAQLGYILAVSNYWLNNGNAGNQTFVYGTNQDANLFSLIFSGWAMFLILGGFLSEIFCKALGPKKTVLVADVIFIIGIVLTMIDTFTTVVIGRFVQGLSLGLNIAATSRYLNASASDAKDKWGVAAGTGFCGGWLLETIIGWANMPNTATRANQDYLNGYWLHGIFFLLPLLQIVCAVMDKTDSPKVNPEGGMGDLFKPDGLAALSLWIVFIYSGILLWLAYGLYFFYFADTSATLNYSKLQTWAFLQALVALIFAIVAHILKKRKLATLAGAALIVIFLMITLIMGYQYQYQGTLVGLYQNSGAIIVAILWGIGVGLFVPGALGWAIERLSSKAWCLLLLIVGIVTFFPLNFTLQVYNNGDTLNTKAQLRQLVVIYFVVSTVFTVLAALFWKDGDKAPDTKIRTEALPSTDRQPVTQN